MRTGMMRRERGGRSVRRSCSRVPWLWLAESVGALPVGVGSAAEGGAIVSTSVVHTSSGRAHARTARPFHEAGETGDSITRYVTVFRPAGSTVDFEPESTTGRAWPELGNRVLTCWEMTAIAGMASGSLADPVEQLAS